MYYDRLYSSPDIITVMKPKDSTSGKCGTHREDVKYIQGFTGKLEGKRQPGRPTHIWKDNIKTILQDT
jgi:hypothetical protein